MKSAIITMYDKTNLGNRLQNYAVYHLLGEYGEVNNLIRRYGCEEIKHRNPLLLKTYHKVKDIAKYFLKHNSYKIYNPRNKNFLSFNKFISDGETLDMKTNYKELDKKYDYFIAGSDQVWNPTFGGNGMYINMLSFTSSSKKIALSPSFGITSLTDDQRQEFKERLSDFKCLSCREEQGSQMIREITGRECTTLIDPTLMLSSEEWDKVSKKPDFHNENDKYILLYFLGEMTKEYKDIINNISKRYNLKVIDIYDKNSKYYTCGPSEFIYMIKHCSIMLTDSFHGSVFSYIYNKPFRIFKRIDSIQSMNSRLENLINVLHLSNDIYINMDTFDIEHVLDDPNYDKTILEKEQKKFKDYLDKAFE